MKLKEVEKIEKKEKQKIYERDIDNWIKYENEKNEDWKKHNLKLVRKSNLKKIKLRNYTNAFLIFLGILTLAGVLFYGTYYDSFKSEFICISNLTCGDFVGDGCSDCGDCNPTFICDVPEEITINIINDTGG